ncbi:hypothetical protein IAD21_03778 [Abditibacteriota bacterium]|nr:hypothetical protein IAD21_03778 [Abditibacteriota bacterium]
MSPFNFLRRGTPDSAPKKAAPVSDLKAFERQYPGVQLELRELRARIEAHPTETEPILDRARYFLNSRLPSNRFNCADDCSRALELDPECASAYALRAQSLGDISHPSKISGRWPSRAALDYLSAYALDSTDFASRVAFLKICAVIFRDKTLDERQEELDALHEMLQARVGSERATRSLEDLKSDFNSL